MKNYEHSNFKEINFFLFRGFVKEPKNERCHMKAIEPVSCIVCDGLLSDSDIRSRSRVDFPCNIADGHLDLWNVLQTYRFKKISFKDREKLGTNYGVD